MVVRSRRPVPEWVRNSNSVDYATDTTEVTNWNSVKTPLIQMTPYITRNNRWVWYNTNNLQEDGGTPTLVAMDRHHPIFKDVKLGAKSKVDIYDQSVGSATVSFASTLDRGNGTLIAKALTDDWTIIAEWPAGKPF